MWPIIPLSVLVILGLANKIPKIKNCHLGKFQSTPTDDRSYRQWQERPHLFTLQRFATQWVCWYICSSLNTVWRQLPLRNLSVEDCTVGVAISVRLLKYGELQKDLCTNLTAKHTAQTACPSCSYEQKQQTKACEAKLGPWRLTSTPGHVQRGWH